MQASSSRGRYQGYPYVNPPVNDVPTSNPSQTSRWTNLPRRQISGDPSRTYPVYVPGQAAPPVRLGRKGETSSSTTVTLPQKREPDENPVVYIDLPEDDGSDVSEYREERWEPVRVERTEPSAGSSSQQLPFKPDPNSTPVVYIDLPQDGGSNVSQREPNESQFVQETIFFDPFENRRIDIVKSNTVRSNNSWNSESDVDSIDTPVRIPPPRPQRPRILELSGSSVSGSTATPPISLISSPGSDTYTRPIPESNLPTALPISGFPEPPPAYTEYDIQTPTPTPTLIEQPRPQPPRTQVILPGSPVGIPNMDRKYLKCHHCGMQVHTLVVKEVGMFTHLFALICLIICMLPIVVMIYYVDCLKNKNHFCPNCNKIIAYELPMNTKKVMYVT